MSLKRTSLFKKYILIYSCMVLTACLLLGFAMSNVYMDLDDAEGKERVKQLIKQYYENRRSKVNG